MRLFYWFIIRKLRQNSLRSIVTIVGIAVGVGVVLAIRLANSSSLIGFETALDAVSGKTSLEITGAGIGIAEEQLLELDWLRDYGLVSPVIDRDVLFRPAESEFERAELVRVLGVDLLRDQPFREHRFSDRSSQSEINTQEFLSLLTDSQAVVLAKTFADRHALEIGSSVELIIGDTRVKFRVRGLLTGDGLSKVLDGNFVLMDIAAAQLALGRLGWIDRIDVQLINGQLVDQAQREILSQLPVGLSVQSPERRGVQVERMLEAFHFNLNALSYIALLVGLFLVYDTVSVSVIARRREIGILRTVGVSRWTVLSMFLGEALSLATVGCVLSVPLGWLMAQGAVQMTSSTVSRFWVASVAQVPPLDVGHIGFAFIVGVPLALVAAVLPALEAFRVTPIGSLRSEAELAFRAKLPRRYMVGAALLFLAAGWFITRSPVAGLPVFGVLAVLAVVFGGVLLVPPALFALQRFRSQSLGWFWVEGELARANIAGALRRVSVSVSAMAVSLAMMVAIAVMISSFRNTVMYWVEQTLQADLFITTPRQTSIGDRSPISFEVEDAVASHPGVVAIDSFRSLDLTYGDSLIMVGSGHFDVLFKHGNLLFKTPSNWRDAIADSQGQLVVLISESFSLKFNKTIGDFIELPTTRGPTSFQVGAVYYDYSTDRGQVIMDWGTFATYYDDRRPSALTVYLQDRVDPNRAREELLAEIGLSREVLIRTNALLRRDVLNVFDNTFAITYALEAIALFVSMFGVAATLFTLTLERRKEITMFRLVGAENRHLRRVIVIEAIFLGLVSLAIGLLIGLLLSLILIYVINVQSFGWTIQFNLPIAFLIQAGLLIIAGTALAGLYPASLARRFHMADLSTEG